KDLILSHKLDYASSPEDEYDKHMHVFFELLCFVSGSVNYHVETFERKLKPNDIVLIAPGKYHFAEVDRQELYERYVYKFPIDFLPAHINVNELCETPFFIADPVVEGMIKALDGYVEQFEDDDCYVMGKAQIEMILVMLSHARERTKVETSDEVVSRVIDYVDYHIKDPITLESIARDMHFSPSYLASRFKREMKTSLMKYVRSKKIFVAHTMIGTGAKPHDVAELLSFEDYSTFYRNYVKMIGYPPTGVTKKPAK
ncbi:MAG: AraC family transcriptional regulator, partial [Bacilli bacterium]|nr:AraC family transcriptional regulator [Bacilli bacterium]